MKKFLAIAIALLVSGSMSLQAQKTAIEAVAGINFPYWTAKADGHKSAALGARVGFHVGVRGTTFLGEDVNQSVYVNAALLLSMKGTKDCLILDENLDLITSKPSAFFLDIPIHIGYKYALSNSVALFGEIGPYFGIGLFGTKHIFDKHALKRFDLGAGFRAGAEFKKKFSASLGYDFGFLNLNDGLTGDGKIRQRNVYISLGYRFK